MAAPREPIIIIMGKGGCRHVINAQCSIFMGDKKTGAWFDCPECYEEVMGKRLDLAIIESPLTLVCKACRQLFQKDLRIFDEDDAVCPHCGNAYVIPAMTPESCLVREAAQLCERAMEEALKGPLDVGNGLAMSSNFEHLVDYSELPASMRPKATADQPLNLGGRPARKKKK